MKSVTSFRSLGWILVVIYLPLLYPMAQVHQNYNSNNKNKNNKNYDNNMYHIQRSNPLAALTATLQPQR